MLLLAAVGGVLLVAVLVLSYPLVFGSMESYAAPVQPGAEYSERDALLEAMGELETSFQTGKLSAADYERQKTLMQRQYLSVLEGAGRRS